MILNNPINAGNFVYCMTYVGPHESFTMHNQGDGIYHRSIYVVDGQGIGTITDGQGNVIISKESVPAGELDEEDTRGTYHTITTAEVGLTVITFNPIPETRHLNVEILKGPGSHIISADTSRKVIVCITGPVQANGKSIASLQHAKVFTGNSANLELSENTVCAIVTE